MCPAMKSHRPQTDVISPASMLAFIGIAVYFMLIPAAVLQGQENAPAPRSTPSRQQCSLIIVSDAAIVGDESELPRALRRRRYGDAAEIPGRAGGYWITPMLLRRLCRHGMG